jgi:hypothetical protein
MIAPFRPSEAGPTRRSLLRARMAVARALLPATSENRTGPPLERWKSWIWATWIVLVIAVYLAGLARNLVGH